MASKRLPNKALLPLNGKPLLFYAWNQARKSRSLDRIVIATDSREIARVADDFGAEVVMTSRRAKNGSERVAEVASKIKASLYINVQGDTLSYPNSWLDQLVMMMRSRPKIQFGTIVTRVKSDIELFDPNRVKATLIGPKNNELAGWFSRYPLPYSRENEILGEYASKGRYYLHHGIYAYRPAGLKKYQGWPMGVAEKAESLEQLRILEQGEKIAVLLARGSARSVDSTADLIE
ncbi:3-deoxy-manno-octulosonate cytidylyltransferase [Gemmatimonas aurantiaca]|nr:3-deoxy-manno-octulosonate cytidylyltransferase [Gemmatimonas aurantiaca]